MKILSFFKAGFLCLSTTALLLSCHSGNSHNYGTGSMDSAQNLNVTKFPTNSSKQQHAQYLMQIYANGLYAEKVSQDVMKRSENKNVKKLATFLTDMHTQLNKTIDSIATHKNINLPASITEDQKDLLKVLQSEKGTEFSRDYLRQMLNSHKSSFVLLTQAKTSSDIVIEDWANKTMPKINECIDRITTRQKEIDSLELKTGVK